MRRHLIRAAAVAAVVAALLAFTWPDRQMVSRDIGCARVTDARGGAICNALSSSMQWTWLGHAIVSPGWRVTWDGLRRVYCREHVRVADLPVLTQLSRVGSGADWRLEDGAMDLARLVKSAAGAGDEPETSIFNPANSSYILKSGCGDGRDSAVR